MRWLCVVYVWLGQTSVNGNTTNLEHVLYLCLTLDWRWSDVLLPSTFTRGKTLTTHCLVCRKCAQRLTHTKKWMTFIRRSRQIINEFWRTPSKSQRTDQNSSFFVPWTCVMVCVTGPFDMFIDVIFWHYSYRAAKAPNLFDNLLLYVKPIRFSRWVFLFSPCLSAWSKIQKNRQSENIFIEFHGKWTLFSTYTLRNLCKSHNVLLLVIWKKNHTKSLFSIHMSSKVAVVHSPNFGMFYYFLTN